MFHEIKEALAVFHASRKRQHDRVLARLCLILGCQGRGYAQLELVEQPQIASIAVLAIALVLTQAG